MGDATKRDLDRILKEKKYHERFSPDAIATFKKSGIKPKVANSYDEAFMSYEIDSLVEHGVSPAVAKEYMEKILERNPHIITRDVFSNWSKLMIYKATFISAIHALGITPENVPKNLTEKEFEILGQLGMGNILKIYEFGPRIGQGSNSLVFYNDSNKTSFKCGKQSSLTKEHELLTKVKENNPDQKNVVKLVDFFPSTMADIIELEYINGRTLESILKEKKRLAEDEVIRYSKDVLNGLLELRKAGIYHCDIHDRNIMVDQEKNRAVIIDLGLATTNPKNINPGNRTYGGNNDLISLGQVLYKMTTGHNLFNEGSGLTDYQKTRERIRSQRERVYANPQLKKQMLEKVKYNTQGRLRKSIIYLLNNDLWKQSKTEKVLKIYQLLDSK
jgi:predicted Ser/Thr protein kinase